MKKWILLLTIGLLAQMALAEVADLDIEAAYRVRLSYDKNYNGISDTEKSNVYLANQRFDFGATWRPSDKLSATLGLIFNSHWGDGQNIAPSVLSGLEIKERSGYLQDLLSEANMSWMISDDISLKVGRSYLTVADGTIFHHNDWENVPTHHDGIQLKYDSEFAKFNLFHFIHKTTNYKSTPDSSDFDQILNGVSVDVIALPEDIFTMANVLIFSDKDDTKSPKEGFLNYSASLGLTFIEMLDARLTYAMQTGDRDSKKHEANMLDTELGVNLQEIMGLRAFIGYHQDSGQDDSEKSTQYKSYFYDVHANAGMMDLMRWGNLTDLYGGLSLMPLENLSAGLTYHLFSKTEKSDSKNGSVLTEGDIGSEIDLFAVHKYDGGFEISSRISFFMPEKGWSATNDTTHTQFFVQGKMEF